VKFDRIGLQLNTHRMTESDFRLDDVTLQNGGHDVISRVTCKKVLLPGECTQRHALRIQQRPPVPDP